MLKESKNLEFKEKKTDTFLKTVCAFANFGTGTIKFGISKEGAIVGIDNMTQSRLDIENKINDNINPIPDYSFEEDNENNVLSLIVKEGKDKPYFYKSKSYMRRDTSTVEMDKYALKRFIMDTDNISFDSLQSKNQDLEFTILEKALKEKMGIEIFSLDTLRTLELFSKDYGYNKGAELLADINKYEGIDIVRFGENISIFLDRVRLNRISIIEQYNKAVEKFVQYYTYEEVEGFYRVKKEKIPEDAFREAIANALINRDWDSAANIQVSFFDDRIEITSPGGLPKEVTKEDYLHKELSIPKNPIIANVFYRMGLIERYGTGVQRIQALYRGSESQPIFEVSDNLIKIVLPLLKGTTQILTDKMGDMTGIMTDMPDKMTDISNKMTDINRSNTRMTDIERKAKVIELFKTQDFVNNAIVRESIDFGEATIKRLLNEMVEEGTLRAEGENKGRKYYLVEKGN